MPPPPRPGDPFPGRVPRRTSWSPPRLATALLATALLVVRPRLVRAEDSIAYKYEDYSEEDGRVAVITQTAAVNADLGTDTHLALTGVTDAITGATPNGEPAPANQTQVPLSGIHDRRKAWDGELTRQFSLVAVTAGFADSREDDYVSQGWSINTATDLNQKNTTLLLGAAGTDDTVQVYFQNPWLKKRTNEVTAGLTQLWDANTTVSVNATWGRATGFLSDPHRLVQKSIQIFPGIFLPETFPENRPTERNKGDLLLAVNRAFPAAHGALEASYRYYRDTFGIGANTFEAGWFQKLGPAWILRPDLRYYQQGAANFYAYQLDDTSLIPTHLPNPRGPFYSSDYRLSAFDSYDLGLKAIWSPADHWRADLAWDRYQMRGRDGVTPQSAYSRARILTAGLTFLW